MNTMTRELRLEVIQIDAGDGARVMIAGELSVRTAARARALLTDALRSGQSQVIVDVDAVETLDAAGLVAVTAPVMGARRQGYSVGITQPILPEPRRFSRLVGVLPLAPNAV